MKFAIRLLVTVIVVSLSMAVFGIVKIHNERINWKSNMAKHIQIRGCLDLSLNGKFQGQEFPKLKVKCKKVINNFKKELKDDQSRKIKEFLDTFGDPEDDYGDMK